MVPGGEVPVMKPFERDAAVADWTSPPGNGIHQWGVPS